MHTIKLALVPLNSWLSPANLFAPPALSRAQYSYYSDISINAVLPSAGKVQVRYLDQRRPERFRRARITRSVLANQCGRFVQDFASLGDLFLQPGNLLFISFPFQGRTGSCWKQTATRKHLLLARAIR